jgi:hypothetical protein
MPQKENSPQMKKSNPDSYRDKSKNGLPNFEFLIFSIETSQCNYYNLQQAR